MDLTKVPIVSICIPAYKQTEYLRVLLNSIREQRFDDFEIVLTDDTPGNEVESVVKEYEFSQEVRYHRNDPQQGSPGNWNATLALARGRYLKLMHHDDAFNSPDSLSRMVNVMEEGKYDYLFCETYVKNVKFPDRNRINRIVKFNKFLKNPNRLFYGNSLGAPSALMVRNHRFPGLEYDTKFIWLVDLEYYIRLMKASSNGTVVHEPLILTHDSADHQITEKVLGDFELRWKEQVMLYERIVPETSWFQRILMDSLLVRILQKERKTEEALLNEFRQAPFLVRLYFKWSGNPLLNLLLRIFVRAIIFIRTQLFKRT